MIAIDPANITLEIVCTIPPEPAVAFMTDLAEDFGVKANHIGGLLVAFEILHGVRIIRRNAIRRGIADKNDLRSGRTASVARSDWAVVEALCEGYWGKRQAS